MNELSTQQLREALQLSEQIDSLQQRLKSIVGGSTLAPSSPAAAKGPKTSRKTTRGKRGRRTMSPEGRARIAAAVKARWAQRKGAGATEAKSPTKRKRSITPEGRAKIAAAMKARWAARKQAAA